MKLTLQICAPENFRWCRWGAEQRVEHVQTRERGPPSAPAEFFFLLFLAFPKVTISIHMNSFQHCVCQPPLSPNCDCDPSSSTPDSSCPQDQRCLGNCQCQLCPQSDGQDRQGQKVLNPPLTLVVDTTKVVVLILGWYYLG